MTIKDNQTILIKSTNNSSSIKAVLNLHKSEKKVLLLTNSNSSLLKETLEDLQNNLDQFDTLYRKIETMFLKDRLRILEKNENKHSFIDELELLIKDEKYHSIYFHRLDMLLSCISRYECEYIVSKIIYCCKKQDKKVIFSLNNMTIFGKLLEDILTCKVNQNYIINDKNTQNKSMLVLMNSADNKLVISSALKFLNHDEKIVILSSNNSVLFTHAIKELKQQIPNFENIHKKIIYFKLKDSYEKLDKMYELPTFLYELKELINSQDATTIYFHKIDKIFDNSTKEELETIISYIKEFSYNYQKKVLISIDEDTKIGKILKPILNLSVDYEYQVKEQQMKSINLIPANLTIIKPNNKRKSI